MHQWQINSIVTSIESEVRETELQFRELTKTVAQFKWEDRAAESQRDPSLLMIKITDYFFKDLNDLL